MRVISAVALPEAGIVPLTLGPERCAGVPADRRAAEFERPRHAGAAAIAEDGYLAGRQRAELALQPGGVEDERLSLRVIGSARLTTEIANGLVGDGADGTAAVRS